MNSVIVRARTNLRPMRDDLRSAKAVGLLLGLAAALVSVRSPMFEKYINISAILILCAFAVAICSSERGTIRSLRVTSIDVLLIVFFSSRVIAEFVNSAALNIPFSMTTLLDAVFAYIAFISARLVISGTDQAVVFLRYLTAPAVMVAVVAILQIAGVPGINDLLVAHVNSGGLVNRLDGGWAIRATSTIGHWTALGGYLCVAIAIRCVLVLRAPSAPRADWTVLLVLTVGQLATLTFATIAVTLATLVTILFLKRVSPLRIGSLFIGLGVLWFFSGSLLTERIEKQAQGSSSLGEAYSWLPESVGFRANIWITETIPGIAERPFLGWGIATYRFLGTGRASDHLRWISPESEWMRTAISSGVIVLAVQVVLLFAVWRLFIRSRDVLGPRILWPIMTMYVGLIVISTIHSHFSNRGVPLLLWPLIGAIAALSYRHNSQSRIVLNDDLIRFDNRRSVINV